MGVNSVLRLICSALLATIVVASVGVPGGAAAVARRPAIVSVTTGGIDMTHPVQVGKHVVLTVHVRLATTCTFRAQHQPFSSYYLVRTVACASGRARVAMPLLKNPYGKTSKVGFIVSVHGRGGVVQKHVTVAVAAAQASSGSTPSTTPTAPVPPAPPTPVAPVASTAIPAGPPSAVYVSPNWSGYFAGGGPFTAVTGTFNVPLLAASPTQTLMSAWAGIDGADNSSLIQAGIAEEYDPVSNAVYPHAWWEILPNLETPIPMPIAPGDEMTVSIGQISGTEWEISITDVTQNLHFVTDQTYTGPGDSAEWIVEAPSIPAPGSTDPSNATVATLGIYTPNVTFTNLAVNGPQSNINVVAMVQNDAVVSAPSPLTVNGFSVAYGDTSPPGP